jgi:CubicO group peptidase (beta-lactamase class C family)
MLCPALARTSVALEAGLGSVHVGAQLFVSVRGRVVAEAALGLARPDVPMSTTTLMPWMSCTKLVTATAFALVWDRGLVTLDAPVSRYVPEFEAGGKGGITLRHLLTHTAGLLPCEQALGPVRYQQSFADTCTAIYEDLGLAG